MDEAHPVEILYAHEGLPHRRMVGGCHQRDLLVSHDGGREAVGHGSGHQYDVDLV
nr:hypothetical protein [Streptomyces sulfonofaciens]